jgi:hypothetical protein
MRIENKCRLDQVLKMCARLSFGMHAKNQENARQNQERNFGEISSNDYC